MSVNIILKYFFSLYCDLYGGRVVIYDYYAVLKY